MYTKIVKNKSLAFVGFLQATGVAIYCGGIGYLMINGDEIFGVIDSFVGPAMFLILFVVSALVTSLMVFYQPVILFWDKKKVRDAISLVGFTAAWLLLYLIIVLFLVSFS